ncbi:MAG: PIN domain-containing protein [Thermodesulfobacteriota bacterium]|nr:PIN domain-containing protein [Thermodesulfobacteriota bacterium]
MPDKIFFDTNILVYLANEDSPFHIEVAKTFKEIAGKSELWISRQVLREYAVVMTRH